MNDGIFISGVYVLLQINQQYECHFNKSIAKLDGIQNWKQESTWRYLIERDLENVGDVSFKEKTNYKP